MHFTQLVRPLSQQNPVNVFDMHWVQEQEISCQKYSKMEIIYYKREGMPAWKWPGCVIGMEGQMVIVKHWSVYVRVYLSCLMHENAEFEININANKNNSPSKDETFSRASMAEETTSDEDILNKSSENSVYNLPEVIQNSMDHHEVQVSSDTYPGS